MIFCQMIVTFIGNVIKSLTIQGLHDNVFTYIAKQQFMMTK